MNTRRVAAVCGLVSICGALVYHLASAAPPSKDTKQELPAMRSAQAQLRLAELTLQKAKEINRKVPRTLSTGLIEAFTDEVDFAKLHLQHVTNTNSVDDFADSITRAELILRAAEIKLKKAARANEAAPGAVGETDLERMRLGVEVAGLRLERGRSLANASPEAKMQWQFEVLSDSLGRVAQQLAVISQNRLQEF